MQSRREVRGRLPQLCAHSCPPDPRPAHSQVQQKEAEAEEAAEAAEAAHGARVREAW